MKKRAVLLSVLFFLIGHISASFQSLSIWLLMLLCLLNGLLIIGIRLHTPKVMTGLLLALFIIGSLERYVVDIRNISPLEKQLDLVSWTTNEMLDNDIELQAKALGVIVSEVEIDGNIVSFTFEARELFLYEQEMYITEKEQFIVRLQLEQEQELLQAASWVRGLNIELLGTITRPSEANNRGMFNYREYLHKKGIHWVWRSKGSSSLIVIEGEFHYSRLLHFIDKTRNRLAAPLDHLYSEAESGYLKGLILGIRSSLDPEQFRSFSTIGLTHILAISGLHVAVFMYIVTIILKWFRCGKELIITILLLAVPCYVALTGASPSVLRAGLMAMLGLLAARAGKLKDGLHIIAVVAAMLVLFKPYLIHDISFQLSFIVTLGLIAGVPAVQSIMPKKKRWKWLTDSLAVTLVAQIISFPLTIFYFNQFHLLSLLANLILVPFISMLVMPLGSLSLLAGHISIEIAKPLSWLVHWCNDLSFKIVSVFNSVNGLYTIWASPPILWILLWYGVWFSLFYYWRKQSTFLSLDAYDDNTEPLFASDELTAIFLQQKEGWWVKQRISIISFFSVCALLAYAYFPQLLQTAATVSFLNVGQGDASLIRTPSGKMLLVDGGGTVRFGEQESWKKRKDPFEIGKNVLLPILMKRGVHQLDIVIITHLDSDHIGGLIEVIKHIPVNQIWWNGSLASSSDAAQLFELIVKKNIPIKVPLVGEKIKIDQHTAIEMLWPAEEQPQTLEIEKKQNEISLVFLLTIYSTNLLYTGDISAQTEDLIIKKQFIENKKELPNIHIMKAAHHGSRYSTDYSWLSYAEPQATVISAGRNNVYGHPHQDVLKRLKQYRSLVFRTDQQGELQFKIEKQRSYYLKWN